MGTSSIYQKPGRKNFYLHVYDPKTRRRYRESAHTTDENVALQRLAEAERLVTLGGYIPPAERKRLSERENLSLHQAVLEYVTNMVNDRKPVSYVVNVRYLLSNFVEFFEAVRFVAGEYSVEEEVPKCRLRIAAYKKTAQEEALRLLEPVSTDRPARLITEQLIEAYKHHRLDIDDADETTVNNELKILRMFGKWLVRRADFLRNPFENVHDVEDQGPPTGRCLRVDQFGGFAHSSDPNLQMWAVTAGLHGMRLQEPNHLRPEDINIEEGYFNIRKHWSSDGELIWRPKFGKERKVPIVEAAIPYARMLRDLPTDRDGHVIGVHDRRKARDRALVRAGIDGHVTFHDFRHTAYTHLKEKLIETLDPAIALAEMRKIFGHSDGTMDAIYDHRTVDRLRRVISVTPLAPAVSDLLNVA